MTCGGWSEAGFGGLVRGGGLEEIPIFDNTVILLVINFVICERSKQRSHERLQESQGRGPTGGWVAKRVGVPPKCLPYNQDCL